MGIYSKIKKRLGYNTIEKHELNKTLYKYTVIHTNGKENEVIANYKVREKGGFVEFYKYIDEVRRRSYNNDKVLILLGDPWLKHEKVRELESIEEIKKEAIKNVTFNVYVDRATGKLANEEDVREHFDL